jgi:hypothetical protein
MSTKDNVHGEGNYDASRKYNEATKKFVESGRVEQAARDAAPKNEGEAASMKRAEEAALLRAKEEDPAVREPQTPEPKIDDPKREPRKPDAIKDPPRSRTNAQSK